MGTEQEKLENPRILCPCLVACGFVSVFLPALSQQNNCDWPETLPSEAGKVWVVLWQTPGSFWSLHGYKVSGMFPIFLSF